MRSALLAAVVATVATMIVCPRPGRADEPAGEKPQLDANHPVQCLTDAKGVVWRVQCDEERKACLYAPSHELDEDGEWSRPLERVRPCDATGDFDPDALRKDGYSLGEAQADTPRGWMRDARGRVFQVTFDLHRRLYAGVSWAPSLRDAGGDGVDASRLRLDFGLFEWERSFGTRKAGFRHRLRLVEGDVQLAPFRADATLVHYDFSRRSQIPLVRITTFWGTPRRYDVAAHVGLWAELAHLEVDEVRPGTNESLWRLGTLHATWDLWRSEDMTSFVRVRGGAGIERTVVAAGEGVDRDAVTPGGAADVDLSLDADGFHHVTATAQLEKPQFLGDARDLRKSGTRAQARVAYEMILVAVNDQPLTLRVAGEAEYRNDVPGVAAGWDLRAIAGVRLSLWAPAR